MYNLTKTNLTWIRVTAPDANNSSQQSILYDYVINIYGNIQIFKNHIALTYFNLWGLKNITGDIGIIFANWYKIMHIEIQGSWGFDSVDTTGTTITGNISILSDKYDSSVIGLTGRKGVNGEVKSLKNLKKIWYLALNLTSCTGSKTDLYNQGANVTTFRI